MQYGGNSAAPIFYRAVAYHGILSYICRMNEKLLFRRARPADTERIMEIIRQAQAQMRALGSLQWHGCTGNRRHGGCGVPGCNGCRGENNGHGGGRQNRSIRR